MFDKVPYHYSKFILVTLFFQYFIKIGSFCSVPLTYTVFHYLSNGDVSLFQKVLAYTQVQKLPNTKLLHCSAHGYCHKRGRELVN